MSPEHYFRILVDLINLMKEADFCFHAKALTLRIIMVCTGVVVSVVDPFIVSPHHVHT